MTSALGPAVRTTAKARGGGSWPEVLLAFLRLGLTSFGGPAAHLGYFRADIVDRRRWLDEESYADIVALCQFLPGPASSQVAVTLGLLRAGFPGALAAWFGFSMPSALLLMAFGYGIGSLGDLNHAAWLHGLKIVAVAVVAQAVWGMARNLCPDRGRATMAVGAALLALSMPSASGQVLAIGMGALVGRWCFPAPQNDNRIPLQIAVPHSTAIASLVLFAALLFGLQIAAPVDHLLALVDAFYRSGSLVFGGGHVVLPLLQKAVVAPGWLTNDAFLAGYGATQAMPGPLFTFSAYLGTVMNGWPNGLLGGMICLVAIYLPSFLLLIGILPFWDALRRRAGVQAALRGVNAAVVGLLAAAFYTPVWTSAIGTSGDFGIALAALLALALWRVPPWVVVIVGATATSALTLLPL